MVVVAFSDQLPDLYLCLDPPRTHLSDHRTRKISYRRTQIRHPSC